MPEYIARISYGKDSLKMLDVIHSRGLPLDRITTTDVWATDTISANLPPVEAFKAKMDQWIWDRYRIEVEHLCARNKDGSKKTYEQMFYHVPVRRSQTVQAERESTGSGSARSADFPIYGTRGVNLHSRETFQTIENKGRSRAFLQTRGITGVKNSRFARTSVSSFPISQKPRPGKEVSWNISA